jgi:hypothetical protein
MLTFVQDCDVFDTVFPKGIISSEPSPRIRAYYQVGFVIDDVFRDALIKS